MATMALDIGGAETHIVELAKALARRGVRVFVASNGGSYVNELEEAGITHIKVPLHNKSIINIIVSYNLLKRAIIENHIDVVHGHARIPSFICGKLHKKLFFRFVTTAHGVFNPKLPYRFLTNWGEATLAVSEDIMAYLIKYYGLDSKKVKVTINGIDTEKFSSSTDWSDLATEFGLTRRYIGEGSASLVRRIVHVGRIDRGNSITAHQLISISKDLFKHFQGLEIIIVGGGSDFAKVNAAAESANLEMGSNVIRMIGSRTDINKWDTMGDIFVGLSRSSLEAMACECPTIVGGNSGYLGIFNRNVLDEAMAGNFCCRDCVPSTPDRLMSDLLYLLLECSDYELRNLGKFGRETVKAHYSVERMADDAMEVYNG
jgi:glycosyltransferase involved in cell wall biosynthesis